MTQWVEILVAVVVSIVGAVIVVANGYFVIWEKWWKGRQERRTAARISDNQIAQADLAVKASEIDVVAKYFKSMSDERKAVHEADVKRLESELGRNRREFEEYRAIAEERFEALRDAEQRCQIKVAELEAFARSKGWRFVPRPKHEAGETEEQ